MASSDLNQYKYFINGRYIGILSYDEEEGYYRTPDEDDAAAIMLEYTMIAANVTTETDSIDIDDSLARAIVYYVKCRIAEDVGREDLARLYKAKFYYHIQRSQNNKRGVDVRISIPRGVTVLK